MMDDVMDTNSALQDRVGLFFIRDFEEALPACDLWQLHTPVSHGVVWPRSVPMTNEFADWLTEFAKRPERSERPYRVYDLVEVTGHGEGFHKTLLGTVFSFSAAADLGEFRQQRAKTVGA
jgi:hypothetical protein